MQTALDSTYLKIKYLGKLDKLVEYINNIPADLILRIDFNNALSFDEVISFWDQVEFKDRIEYLEDPVLLSNKTDARLRAIGVPMACDRNIFNDQNYMFQVLKPNRDFIPDKSRHKIIFSSYMGHEIGIYHSFLHLLTYGDLTLYHGIDTPGIYEEYNGLFNNHKDSLIIDEKKIENLYEDLKNKKWKAL